MADWTWPSLEDKLETIGYLAIPGVISAIEATVPKGKKEKFRKDYAGLYSDEYPYEADKYGKQFRIYLNDTDGSPDFLREHLDGAYGNRINNTNFIDELVREYGFRFTRQAQNIKKIFELVYEKHGSAGIDALRKGYDVYQNFVEDIEKIVNEDDKTVSPNALKYSEKAIARKSGNKSDVGKEQVSGFTPNEILKIGWAGEAYITNLLKNRDKTIMSELNIPQNKSYTVEWFNDGVKYAEEEFISYSSGEKFILEKAKIWDDKSVGKGYDILVVMDSGEEFCIEVKTSKRAYPFFTMTSVEMQEMELRGNKYALIKINNFEKLIKHQAPDIITIINPYEKLFHPKHMKEATFTIGGK